VQFFRFLPFGFAAGFTGAMSGSNQPTVSSMLPMVAWATSFSMAWLYLALFESSDSMATPGKMALGLRVTKAYGERIGFGQATGRFFGKILSSQICSIGFLMAAFTERKQALHDQLADTYVIATR